MHNIIRRLLVLMSAWFLAFNMHGIFARAEGEEEPQVPQVPVVQVGDTQYTTLSDALANWNDGTVMTLLEDVQSTSTITIADKAVTLELNGHEFKYTGEAPGNSLDAGSCGSVFKINTGGDLTVRDSGEGTGKITGGRGRLDVIDHPSTYTYTLYYNGGNVYVDGGSLTLESGSITANTYNRHQYYTSVLHGGGVYVKGGTFIMNGGSVSGNSAEDRGCGVFVEGGTFIMNDGLIQNNTFQGSSYRYGGGVYVNGGTFTMNGGKISGHAADNYYGQASGLYIAAGT
ncbi:MAG: hypothetical protein IKD69_02985, partial [Solobacterium sp.]|nr:hypothetical protein [Solobacterium sp.]